MKSSIIHFNAKSAPGYHPSIIIHSSNLTAADNYTVRIPAKSKGQPAQFAHMLAQEIRVPLGHIDLSVEMLDSLINENDLKIYLEVIKRNSIRISNLVNTFLKARRVS